MARPTRPDPGPLLGRLREFQREVRDLARTGDGVGITGGTPAGTLSQHEAEIVRRLGSVAPDLALSLEQALIDVADVARRTYVAPAGEAREVMRAAIHRLAPDAAVKNETWFKGDNGQPTQAERVRFAAERRGGASPDPAVEASGLVEERLGRFGRVVYQRASKALHAGTQRAEARRIINAVLLVLDDVLPD